MGVNLFQKNPEIDIFRFTVLEFGCFWGRPLGSIRMDYESLLAHCDLDPEFDRFEYGTLAFF